jgi:hypothetical protein
LEGRNVNGRKERTFMNGRKERLCKEGRKGCGRKEEYFIGRNVHERKEGRNGREEGRGI